MSLIMVGAVEVHDSELYKTYVETGFAAIRKYNVEVLAYGTPAAVEGTVPGQPFVDLRFDDQAAFDEWYKSPEYQAALPIRHEAANTHFLVTIGSPEQ